MMSMASSQVMRVNCAVALGTDALHRILQPVGMVDAFQVACDLLAEKAARERMVRIAAQVDGPAILDRDDHAAGIGAIVRADGADRLVKGQVHGRASIWVYN